MKGDLPDLVEAALARIGVEPGAHLLIGCSGGPDSMALLDLLHRISATYPLVLSVASFNHGLREEAAQEVELVRSRAAELGLKFLAGRAGSSAYPESGNLQETARELRHAFLEQARADSGAELIALAHHAEDQAETILMNLLRGTGLKGLGGMAPLSGRLLRPLLDLAREKIRAYVEDRGLEFAEDPSNEDPAFLRVRVRTDIIPALTIENPSLIKTLGRLATACRDDEAVLEELTRAQLNGLGRTEEEAFRLDRADLTGLRPGLARRLIRAGLKRVKGDLRRIELNHVDQVLDLAAKERGRISLPGGLVAVVTGEELTLALETAPALAPLKAQEIPGPGEYRLSTGVVMRIEETSRTAEPPAEPDSVLIDAEALTWPLVVRPAVPGDRFSPLGMEGTKKLADLYVDRKLDRVARTRVPVVLSGERILWVAGLALDREAALSGSTQKRFRLRLIGE